MNSVTQKNLDDPRLPAHIRKACGVIAAAGFDPHISLVDVGWGEDASFRCSLGVVVTKGDSRFKVHSHRVNSTTILASGPRAVESFRGFHFTSGTDGSTILLYPSVKENAVMPEEDAMRFAYALAMCSTAGVVDTYLAWHATPPEEIRAWWADADQPAEQMAAPAP